jgi:hypothetical protein
VGTATIATSFHRKISRRAFTLTLTINVSPRTYQFAGSPLGGRKSPVHDLCPPYNTDDVSDVGLHERGTMFQNLP